MRNKSQNHGLTIIIWYKVLKFHQRRLQLSGFWYKCECHLKEIKLQSLNHSQIHMATWDKDHGFVKPMVSLINIDF